MALEWISAQATAVFFTIAGNTICPKTQSASGKFLNSLIVFVHSGYLLSVLRILLLDSAGYCIWLWLVLCFHSRNAKSWYWRVCSFRAKVRRNTCLPLLSLELLIKKPNIILQVVSCISHTHHEHGYQGIYCKFGWHLTMLSTASHQLPTKPIKGAPYTLVE